MFPHNPGNIACRPATEAVVYPHALPVGIPGHVVTKAAAPEALSYLWFAHLGSVDAPGAVMSGGALKPSGLPFLGLELGVPFAHSPSGRMYRAVYRGKDVALKVRYGLKRRAVISRTHCWSH